MSDTIDNETNADHPALEDDVAQWMAAGSETLLMNSPMSPNRFEDLAAAVADAARGNVVDFGCGRGAFTHRIAELNPSAQVRGLDTSRASITHATNVAAEAGFASRLSYERIDASLWTGQVDIASCIGSSHAFGDSASMFMRLGEVGATSAVIGDGFWVTEPDEWCLENLGEMPRGLDALERLANAAGWTVHAADISTFDEWETFERLWGEGVRSVGTPGAAAFADQRAQDSGRYRDALGFAWLQLSR